jgi:hypothetical protein
VRGNTLHRYVLEAVAGQEVAVGEARVGRSGVGYGEAPVDKWNMWA